MKSSYSLSCCFPKEQGMCAIPQTPLPRCLTESLGNPEISPPRLQKFWLKNTCSKADLYSTFPVPDFGPIFLATATINLWNSLWCVSLGKTSLTTECVKMISFQSICQVRARKFWSKVYAAAGPLTLITQSSSTTLDMKSLSPYLVLHITSPVWPVSSWTRVDFSGSRNGKLQNTTVLMSWSGTVVALASRRSQLAYNTLLIQSWWMLEKPLVFWGPIPSCELSRCSSQ